MHLDDIPEDKSNPLVGFIDRLPASVRGKLISLYRESLSRESTLILAALGRDDLGAAGALAHKLWGGAANLQDTEVARIAKLIEVAALENRLSAAKEAGSALGNQCLASATALQRYVVAKDQ